jgi:transposase
MLKYGEKHNVTETCIRYKTSRKTYYKWKKRYDGTIESLKDRSHRPHCHPAEHTEAEKRLIKKVVKRYKWKDLILSYQVLLKKGYRRSYGGFKRIVQKLKDLKPSKKKVKKKPKPYTRASYPGQKIQIDVKYVPTKCVMGGGKYYQFTAKDECTRWTYRQMYNEHSTYSAKQFIESLVRIAPFPIRMVQTDNRDRKISARYASKRVFAKGENHEEQSLQMRYW